MPFELRMGEAAKHIARRPKTTGFQVRCVHELKAYES